jgi:serine/threonine protein kinase
MLKYLQSKYISNLEEVYETTEKIVLVLEFLQQDLVNLFREKSREIKEKDLKSIIKQTLTALNFIHNKGVIHRDIKPDNLMISKDGRKIKLIDFGLACWTDSDDEFRFQKCGTTTFMAPEMMNGYVYDSKVDIYSLGVTFFMM